MTEAAPPPAGRSLLSRTSAVLAAAIVVFFGALVLGLRPWLADAFVERSVRMLRENDTLARAAAGEEGLATDEVLRAAVAHAHEQVTQSVLEAPLELVTPDAEKVRALLDARMRRAVEGTRENLVALAAEMQSRTAARLDASAREAAERSRRDANEFGADLGGRAASILLAISAGIFLVHGLVLWRSVLAPVARLSHATREVAQGRLGVRLPVRSDDEVSRLAASFNAMTTSLERAQTELVRLNATLEDRVREKSQALLQAERELRHAEKMASLGTLAGGVAHEFNNLLGGIQGCAEDAARETDPDELKQTLAVIERTARRGSAITEKLLRFARPSAPGQNEVDVAAVARDVAALVAPEASRQGIEVAVEAPPKSVLRADPTGVHQVMLNLATNAVHAMPKGGRLTIRVTGEEGGVRIAVTDTGVGIAAQDRAKLFEPFFTTRPEGTGLGLSVSYAIARAHGGHIDVESSPGEGTTFTVVLRAQPQEAAG